MESRQSEPDTCIPLLIYPPDLSLPPLPITQANGPSLLSCPESRLVPTIYTYAAVPRKRRDDYTRGPVLFLSAGFLGPGLNEHPILISRAPRALCITVLLLP